MKMDAYIQLFFFNHTTTTEIYTLSLHDALPICPSRPLISVSASTSMFSCAKMRSTRRTRSEEHTSELQSRRDLVCRLLLEKKKRSSGCGPSVREYPNRRCALRRMQFPSDDASWS